MAEREMPRYKCHKKVWALKIAKVEGSTLHFEEDGPFLHFKEEGYDPRVMSKEYMSKHQPKAGGYLVQYEDGYLSWSPAKAFEEGYTRVA